ncbi:class I SAM-dependent methyltransferase [Beggiatoa leptomitoformis]|uniref:Methyltransferase domain-containing protein n=1 Tax=Beggiatoa leptomitoformis TaxID=288004 RepID=A0A2N9YFF4_9GAMM|nr:class I SAM-dependent methyltransferase [Beggiatoa leptomitoformis]ALG68556.1 methyltransferase domain-containing protein [Beggiatoa leptomitoformis]AUI69099.1 methyltransferase domain-containing protein [Beggiatoa leptomitoformis]
MKDFYTDAHVKIASVQKNLSCSEQAKFTQEMSTKGHRYFCIFDTLTALKELNAVELGFGYVSFAMALSSLFKEYTAVDVAASTIMQGFPTVDLTYKDADLNEDFPFSDNQFDVVIGMMILEHLFDPFHSFKEIARICKPNGYLFINLPNITSMRCRLDLLMGKMPFTGDKYWFERRMWDSAHLHYFDIKHVKMVAELSGLTLVNIYPVGRFYGLKKYFPNLLCHEISYVFTKKEHLRKL